MRYTIYFMLTFLICGYGYAETKNKQSKIRCDLICCKDLDKINERKDSLLFLVSFEYLERGNDSNKKINYYLYDYYVKKEMAILLYKKIKENKSKEIKISYHDAIYIHKNVMKDLGLPYESWFFAHIFEVLSDDKEKEYFWSQYLELMQKAETKEELAFMYKIILKMLYVEKFDQSDKREKAKKWMMVLNKLPFSKALTNRQR